MVKDNAVRRKGQQIEYLSESCRVGADCAVQSRVASAITGGAQKSRVGIMMTIGRLYG